MFQPVWCAPLGALCLKNVPSICEDTARAYSITSSSSLELPSSPLPCSGPDDGSVFDDRRCFLRSDFRLCFLDLRFSFRRSPSSPCRLLDLSGGLRSPVLPPSFSCTSTQPEHRRENDHSLQERACNRHKHHISAEPSTQYGDPNG